MIQPFVDAFMANKQKLEAQFRVKRPDSYLEIMKAVVAIVDVESGDFFAHKLYPLEVSQVLAGEYQGDYVFIITTKDYPTSIWYTTVAYGSCSGCDTLKRIEDDVLDEEQKIKDYMTLALHLVQGIKVLGETTTAMCFPPKEEEPKEKNPGDLAARFDNWADRVAFLENSLKDHKETQCLVTAQCIAATQQAIERLDGIERRLAELTTPSP